MPIELVLFLIFAVAWLIFADLMKMKHQDDLRRERITDLCDDQYRPDSDAYFARRCGREYMDRVYGEAV